MCVTILEIDDVLDSKLYDLDERLKNKHSYRLKDKYLTNSGRKVWLSSKDYGLFKIRLVNLCIRVYWDVRVY